MRDWPGGGRFLRCFPPELSTSPQQVRFRTDGLRAPFPLPRIRAQMAPKSARGEGGAAVPDARSPPLYPQVWID